MPLADVLRAEVLGGLRRLRGARVSAVVPVRQAVLDEVVRLVPGLPPDLAIALGGERHVQVRYGVFHANGRLAPGFSGRAPSLTVELASQLVAWGLQRLSLPPFVAVRGRLVHVDLTRVPALADLAPLWPHVEAVSFASIPGRLDVRLDLHVTADERNT